MWIGCSGHVSTWGMVVVVVVVGKGSVFPTRLAVPVCTISGWKRKEPTKHSWTQRHGMRKRGERERDKDKETEVWYQCCPRRRRRKMRSGHESVASILAPPPPPPPCIALQCSAVQCNWLTQHGFMHSTLGKQQAPSAPIKSPFCLHVPAHNFCGSGLPNTPCELS